MAAFKRSEVASLLHVSARTVRNWEGGATRVPYSAFKLIRIFSGYALPGEAWEGWMIRGDTLWSAEEKPFRACDLAWWSLTVAMARDWKRLHRERMAGSNEPTSKEKALAGTGQTPGRRNGLDLAYRNGLAKGAGGSPLAGGSCAQVSMPPASNTTPFNPIMRLNDTKRDDSIGEIE